MPVQRPVKWQEEQAALVDDETEALLASLPDATGFREVIEQALAGSRRGIAAGTASRKPWHLLPLTVCDAVCGRCEKAIPASAALRLFTAAGEVFDDVEDADQPGSLSARFGPAIATNAATALVILAEKAISRLKGRGVPDDVTVHVMEAVNSYYAGACAGQHLDLSLGSDSSMSEDAYLRIASMKSATNIECACHVGALVGSASMEIVDCCTDFGRNLGMSSQIANDVRGVISGKDIEGRKVTLPVVYGLAHGEGEALSRLRLAFGKERAVVDPEEVKTLLFSIGAVHYAVLRMETYRQQALDILNVLERNGLDVARLRLFLE